MLAAHADRAGALLVDLAQLDLGVAALNIYPQPNFSAGSGINFTSQNPNSSPRREDMLRLDFQATDNWRITGAVNWIDHSYDSGTFLPDLRTPPDGEEEPQPIDLTQYDVPFSPEFKFMLGAAYDWNLASGKRVTLNGALNYQDEAETDVFNGVNTQMEARTLVDLSATLHDRDDRWSLTGYVSNALDEGSSTFSHPVSQGFN